MGIEVQQTHAWVFLGARHDRAVGNGVVTTEGDRQLSLVQALAGPIEHKGVQLGANGVDPREHGLALGG